MSILYVFKHTMYCKRNIIIKVLNEFFFVCLWINKKVEHASQILTIKIIVSFLLMENEKELCISMSLTL